VDGVGGAVETQVHGDGGEEGDACAGDGGPCWEFGFVSDDGVEATEEGGEHREADDQEDPLGACADFCGRLGQNRGGCVGCHREDGGNLIGQERCVDHPWSSFQACAERVSLCRKRSTTSASAIAASAAATQRTKMTKVWPSAAK